MWSTFQEEMMTITWNVCVCVCVCVCVVPQSGLQEVLGFILTTSIYSWWPVRPRFKPHFNPYWLHGLGDLVQPLYLFSHLQTWDKAHPKGVTLRIKWNNLYKVLTLYQAFLTYGHSSRWDYFFIINYFSFCPGYMKSKKSNHELPSSTDLCPVV